MPTNNIEDKSPDSAPVKKTRRPRKKTQVANEASNEQTKSADTTAQPVAEKPAPMVIGASGFQGDVYGNDPYQERIDWNRLAAFPPFQMFACEKTGNATDSIEFWILGFIHESVTKQGEQPMFNAYCAWHKNKGYWKNETVYGDLKEV